MVQFSIGHRHVEILLHWPRMPDVRVLPDVWAVSVFLVTVMVWDKRAL